MTLAEDVAALQQRIANAQRERNRAEGARDAAQAAYMNASAELQRDFGVTSVEDAEALLETLRGELEHAVAELVETLDRIGV